MNHKCLNHFFVLFLLLINGLAATIAGLMFIKEPDGALMGMHTAILAFSPFEDFLIPGIILVLANGVSSFFVFWKVARYRHAAGYWLIFQGLLSVGWIVGQVILLRSFNLLHFVFGMIGFIFLCTGLQYLKRNINRPGGIA